ncbi:lytic murein transglycosylase (plasmid) [Pseudoalteromonas espejiana]
MTLDKFKGSGLAQWGKTQLMLTSFNAYAVDYNNDMAAKIFGPPKRCFCLYCQLFKARGWNDFVNMGSSGQIARQF